MERIQGQSVLKVKRETDEINQFTAGDPHIHPEKLATALTPEWCNNIQEEIANVIEGFGRKLDTNNAKQLFGVLKTLEIRIKRLESEIPPELGGDNA